MTEHSSHAALSVAGRLPKAEKIRRLLLPETGSRKGVRLLEIGTGSGAIAQHLASLDGSPFQVAAVDVADQRTAFLGFAFHLYDGSRLPFDDAAFDVVVSNHVIEHVGDRARQSTHLREIARMLADGGCAYLASPSRWQFVEPHFRLPGLSWLPRRWRDAYVRLARRGTRYDCDPMTHSELESLSRDCGLQPTNINVEALFTTLELESRRNRLAAVIASIPRSILQRCYRFSPTMVYLLRKGPSIRDAAVWR